MAGSKSTRDDDGKDRSLLSHLLSLATDASAMAPPFMATYARMTAGYLNYALKSNFEVNGISPGLRAPAPPRAVSGALQPLMSRSRRRARSGDRPPSLERSSRGFAGGPEAFAAAGW